MKSHLTFALLLCAALSSCKIFDETAVQVIDSPGSLPEARIKFHNFSPSSVGVNFFANGVKVTAISTTACTPLPTVDSLRQKCLAGGIESTTGVVYGGSASGGLYSGIAAGQATLTAKMAGKDTVIATLAQAISAGKYYTFFLSGIYNTTTKTAESFVVEDPIPTTIDYTMAHVRLVNAVSNGTTNLTLYATPVGTTTTSAVGTDVAYKAGGGFVAIAEGSYDFGARYTGSSTNVTGLSLTAQTLVGGRVYTITTRGNTATSTTMGMNLTSNQR